MWSYYGAKTNIIDLYPKPQHSKIIEPFAGTARYALKYFDRDILLVDKYDVIVKIWKWLQQCSTGDIRSLPRFKKGDNINAHQYNCEEERLLVGYLICFGGITPRDNASHRLRSRPNAMNYTINRIAEQLYKIKHWDIRHDSYENIPNEKATWFVDPPYQHGGQHYKESSKKIDFAYLSQWSQNRDGQIIVCENTKATWMDFKPMTEQFVLSGKNSEAIWSNMPTAYDNQQILLF